jgi:hypothetical protein
MQSQGNFKTKNLILKIFHYKNFLIILFASFIFLLINFYFISDLPYKFNNSPDEMANYYFTKTLALENKIQELEPLNFVADNLIHPRSVTVVNGYQVPTSFVGLPLIYGSIAKIFGIKIVPYLTPIFGFFAGLAFYLICKKIFNQNTAFWAGILFWINPAFWYYTARSMYHNALFIDFLIFSLFFLIFFESERSFLRSIISIIFSGLFFGFALSIRASEIFWLFGACLIVFFFFFKKINWFKMLIFVVTVFLALIPFFYTNEMLYGSPLQVGYTVGYGLGNTSVVHNLKFSPFSFNAKTIIKNFLDYYINFLNWFLLLLVVGLVILMSHIFHNRLKDKKNKIQLIYLLLFLFVTSWLIIYYGSSQFKDEFAAKGISIGNSFVRYWLPSFILSLPLIAMAIVKFLSLFKKGVMRNLVSVFLFLLLFLFSFTKIFYYDPTSLVNVKKNLIRYNQIFDEIKKVTDQNSVIIVDSADKFFFPERKVIVPLRSEATYNVMPKLVKMNIPLYYYGITFPSSDFEHFKERLEKNGLSVEVIKTFDFETLYQIGK